jgi:hypothetical protein
MQLFTVYNFYVTVQFRSLVPKVVTQNNSDIFNFFSATPIQ